MAAIVSSVFITSIIKGYLHNKFEDSSINPSQVMEGWSLKEGLQHLRAPKGPSINRVEGKTQDIFVKILIDTCQNL